MGRVNSCSAHTLGSRQTLHQPTNDLTVFMAPVEVPAGAMQTYHTLRELTGIQDHSKGSWPHLLWLNDTCTISSLRCAAHLKAVWLYPTSPPFPPPTPPALYQDPGSPMKHI